VKAVPVFKDYDVVKLRSDIPDEGIQAGVIGTIVMVYTVPRVGYEVEFMDA
jgi:hypothetical protein